MRVSINKEQSGWLKKNCGFQDLTTEQNVELMLSIPEEGGQWDCPPFASVLIRDKFSEYVERSISLRDEMKAQIVTGVFNVEIGGMGLNG
jgi:hypothetical protein